MIIDLNIEFLVIFLFLSISIVVEGNSSKEKNSLKKQDLYCSACRLMFETIHHEIKNVDPNERVQVGSYRVDGNGHQKLKEVPIIETRFHIENVVENICSKSINHGRQIIESHLKNLHEHACDDILEEHHDDLIDLLVQQVKHIDNERQLVELFCINQYQFCKQDQLEDLFQVPEQSPSEENQSQNKENEENHSKEDL